MLKPPARFSEVFILGVGRSGTTLLRAIMNAHRQVAVAPEAKFVADMLKITRRYQNKNTFDSQKFVADLSRSEYFAYWHIDEQELSSCVEYATSIQNAFELLYQLYGTKQNKHFVLDKSPNNVLEIKLIKKAWPNARFIHIIRDGRDVAISSLQAGWQIKSLQDSIANWAIRIGRCERSLSLLQKNDYIEVYYEDLLRDPKAVVTSICDWIGIEYEPTMLEHPSGKNIGFMETVKNPHIHKNLSKPIKVSNSHWQQLPAKKLKTLESIAFVELKNNHYRIKYAAKKSRITRAYYFARWHYVNTTRRAWYYLRLPKKH